MRTIADLITEVRFNTNNVDSNRFTDAALIRFFDSAQRTIQRTIYNAYPQDMMFPKKKVITIVSGKVSYNLPDDMLTPSSIYGVFSIKTGGRRSTALKRLSLIERTTATGYLLNLGKIELVPVTSATSTQQLEIIYAYLLDRITKVTQRSELPTICEEYMTAFVERKINYVDSSVDIMNSNIFTREEKKEIAALFSDSSRDPKLVPILDDTYTNY